MERERKTAPAMTLFDRFAGWFVFGAWFLLLGTLLAGGTIGIGFVVSAFYHPLHRLAPYREVAVTAILVSAAVGLLVAICSSIALAKGWRHLAGVSVLGSWGVLLMGSAVALMVTRPGPELLDRYAAGQHFIVPWQYRPEGLPSPDSDGFRVTLCMEELRGTYDARCRGGEDLHVAPRQSSTSVSFDERYWRDHLHEMERREPRYGHDVFAYEQSHTSTSGVTKHSVTLYFILEDEKRQVTRLVSCREGIDICRSNVRIDEFAIRYDSVQSAVAHWRETDQELLDLVRSWRAQR